MTEKLYVAASKQPDDEGELEVYSSYGRSFSDTRELADDDGSDMYELVKVSKVQEPVTQQSDGVWTVDTEDGILAFKTELEAHRYASWRLNDGSISIELKAYTEGF